MPLLTILTLFTNSFSSRVSSLHPLSKIPSKHRPKAMKQGQEAITEYLHSTRSLPYVYAQNIAKNATFSLSKTISTIPFHHSTFLSSIHKYLRYHPINEFQFFYESIGIDVSKVNVCLNGNKVFLDEDEHGFSVACVLADFGFPWNKLYMLCTEKDDVFSKEDRDLVRKLSEFKDRYGFDNAVAVGICLAFPDVLSRFCESGELLSDLRRVLLDTDLVKHVKVNVDSFYAVCRKIKLFYDLGCKKGEIGGLLARNHQIFIEYAEDDLVRKIDFFCRLGVDKEQVGLLLLFKPDILDFDLEDRVISVLSLLKHLNLSKKNLKHIEQNYPYVLGKNRMVNLPHIIRAMDLSEWFFNTIKLGEHSLLATYDSSNECEDADDYYRNNLENILSGKYYAHNNSKFDFLHGIGFGENRLTMKVMPKLHGSGSKLYERFNFLLSLGIKFSKLCKMIRLTPQIFNQNTHLLERKVKFLCKDLGSSVEYLCRYPSYLMFDLQNRVQPRFRFYMWLKAQGWCKIECSVCTIVSLTEKSFVAHV